jgi:hypothetical protein
MDLDVVLADMSFSFNTWRKECTKRNLCFRCCNNFDHAHRKICGCPLQEEQWLKKEDIFPIWKSWGGVLREDRRGPFPAKTPPIDKGKKQESISEVDLDSQQPTSKRCSVSGQDFIHALTALNLLPTRPVPSGSEAHIESILGDSMSIVEMMFNAWLSELELDECKSSRIVKTSAINNRPFFHGTFVASKVKLLDLSVLVDSGASTSFINDQVVELYGLTTEALRSSF